MPSEQDFEKYRFYQCVQSVNGYDCHKIEYQYEIKEMSKLVFVDKKVLSFLDNII